MELIKQNDAKYEEYENLLIERDQLVKDAGSIWISYVQTFGQMITEIYEKKIECIKCKKMFAYYQRALNHGGQINQKELKQYMEQEMAAYYRNLRKMQQDKRMPPPPSQRLLRQLLTWLLSILKSPSNRFSMI